MDCQIKLKNSSKSSIQVSIFSSVSFRVWFLEQLCYVVSYFVLDWGRCSRHLTMTNDATDGTRLYTSRVIPQLLLAPSLCLERDDGMQCSWHPVITAAAMQHCSARMLQSPAGPGDITLPPHAASLCFVSGHNFLWMDPSQCHGADLVTPHHCHTVTLTITTRVSPQIWAGLHISKW